MTPLANPAPRPLPAFSDPRVAYIGPDSLLHVVSLDGKTDIPGTPIPLSGMNGDVLYAAGTSPDGKHLAYFGESQVTTLDAASGARSTARTPGVADSTPGWSPDQRYLSFSDTGDVECVNIATGASSTAPQDPLAANSKPQVEGPFDWLDGTHVAVFAIPDTGPPTSFTVPTPVPGSPETRTILESLNVTTNQLRPITTLQALDVTANFSVLPGGQWTLFTNAQYQEQPITPLVALVNNATGAVTPLHHLTSLLPTLGFHSLLWRPNSTQAIVDTGFPQTGNDQYLLIDALRDTATPVALPGFPVAWAPDGSTLVVATGSPASKSAGIGWENGGAVGAGPFTLIAVRIGAGGAIASHVTLTTRAMNIPTLGFLHTA